MQVCSVTWLLISDQPTAFGAVSGAVAGLVAITPAAGFVSPMSAILIGLGAGVLCYMAVNIRPKIGYDDSLDVLGIHGVGGLWGALATGLFASIAMNPDGANGLFFGNPSLFISQVIASLGTIIYSGVVTLIILKVIDLTVGLRVNNEEEVMGLDLSQHGETGYNL